MRMGEYKIVCNGGVFDFQTLVKLLDDAESPARVASAEVLGAMVQKIGEGPMNRFVLTAVAWTHMLTHRHAHTR